MSDIVLEYNCYELYKFINAMKNYVDETEFKLDKDGLHVKFMDMSRIMIAEIYQPYETFLEHNGSEIIVGLNLEDLTEFLRTKKGDKKEVRLSFNQGDGKIAIEKYSPKLNNFGTFTLALIDVDIEDIALENLKSLPYDSKGVFEIKYFSDYMYQAGKLAETVYMEIDDKGFHFKEEGQIGTFDYLIDRKLCEECEGEVRNGYSLNFLKALKPLLEILPPDTNVAFSLKTDHPIRVDLKIKSLGMNMVIFLAPRVEESDPWDDDEEDEC